VCGWRLERPHAAALADCSGCPTGLVSFLFLQVLTPEHGFPGSCVRSFVVARHLVRPLMRHISHLFHPGSLPPIFPPVFPSFPMHRAQSFPFAYPTYPAGPFVLLPTSCGIFFLPHLHGGYLAGPRSFAPLGHPHSGFNWYLKHFSVSLSHVLFSFIQSFYSGVDFFLCTGYSLVVRG
jgi:hypothetical protein